MVYTYSKLSLFLTWFCHTTSIILNGGVCYYSYLLYFNSSCDVISIYNLECLLYTVRTGTRAPGTRTRYRLTSVQFPVAVCPLNERTGRKSLREKGLPVSTYSVFGSSTLA